MTIPRTVKITIDLPGQHIEITREREFGDNPAFFAWQIERAIDRAKESIRGMVEAEHGHQRDYEP